MARDSKSASTSSPLTLAVDIGGSHLKTVVLTASGEMATDRARVATPKPAKPDVVVEALTRLSAQLGPFDRISIGFPGVVRGDRVLTAPNLATRDWANFPLSEILSKALGRPTRMLNDATIQGLGVIDGRGLECVITMGTGMGFALFQDGQVTPHFEMSQHPIKAEKTYDEYVGEKAIEAVGRKHWNKRVRKVMALLETVIGYDALYIGGGNARLIESPLSAKVKTVSNEAGVTGGVRLWDRRMDHVFAQRRAFDA